MSSRKESEGGNGLCGSLPRRRACITWTERIVADGRQTSGQQEANAQQRAKDEKIATLLSQIRVYLPSLRRPGGVLTSDYMVHPTALAHLRRRFNHLCSSLLRNDSLTDMSDRSVLYFELFEWLEVIPSPL